MRKLSEDSLKPGQAALIVTYGNTTRKHRPLDGDLNVLGRSPVCDVALVSPEVAPIHCLILHTADGWRIRDCCGGRHATRVNGHVIQEAALHDGDVIQIGTFSFETRLPTSRRTPLMGSVPAINDGLAARLKRLQGSRRKLVRLALKLRRRARKNQPTPPALAELEQQAECLRGLQRQYETLVKEYESRLGELEKGARELCDERTAFEQERLERQARLDQAEHDLARRQNEAARLLDRRRQELNAFARYLRRCHQQQPLPPVVPSASIEESPVELPESGPDRLTQLHRLKPILARSNAPSAPGDQLREPVESLTDLEQSSADCTVAANL
jgi:pSer/pThr/pTyr-binding forkhead associated (FHA) protein